MGLGTELIGVLKSPFVQYKGAFSLAHFTLSLLFHHSFFPGYFIGEYQSSAGYNRKDSTYFLINSRTRSSRMTPDQFKP